MGIDFHALHFLKNASIEKPLGSVVTIGRQRFHIEKSLFSKIMDSNSGYQNFEFCEKALTQYMGANNVDSIDISDYENASLIHNMNLPLPDLLREKYDVVIDAGSLEHIFNVPMALLNCSQLLKPGGRIFHIAPANNYCGHGFWQFSPELFYSLYSIENGYNNTRIFLADTNQRKNWYFVKKPDNGNRVNVVTSTPLLILVETTKVSSGFSHSSVFQSDYLAIWNSSEPSEVSNNLSFSYKTRLKRISKQNKTIRKLLQKTYSLFLANVNSIIRFKTSLNDNPYLKSVKVGSDLTL
jgi:SAM-dependent methyltransferase